MSVPNASMDDTLIQYVLSAHWSRRIPESIARSVRFKFKVDATADSIRAIIAKYTLRHGGKPVLRKNWPCSKDGAIVEA